MGRIGTILWDKWDFGDYTHVLPFPSSSSLSCFTLLFALLHITYLCLHFIFIV
jgi:hypothetical protein